MADRVQAVVSLVGEQPIPVLLPLLHMKPEVAILVHSERTESQARRVRALISDRIDAQLLCVKAYDVRDTQVKVEEGLQRYTLPGREIWLNFSGGTKPMVLGGFVAAARNGVGLLYLESERGKSILYRYRVASGEVEPAGDPEELPSLLNIKTYIKAHVDDPEFGHAAKTAGEGFEEAVAQALRAYVDEVERGIRFARGNVEIDIAVRCGNQIGIMEVKSGHINRRAIDQLNTAGRPDYLGTYTRKFWIRSRRAASTTQALDELAVARSITVIELPSYERHGVISKEDAEKLVKDVRRALTREP